MFTYRSYHKQRGVSMSVAALKRRLSVGSEFYAEYLGSKTLVVRGNTGVSELTIPDDRWSSKRKVVRQGSTMVSEFLTGGSAGRTTSLGWSGIGVREDAGQYILMNKSDGREFMVIKPVDK